MQKQNFWLFFTLVSLFFGRGIAYEECCDPCVPRSSLSCFVDDIVFAADLIYWKPCVGGLEYATETTAADSVTTLKYKGLCPDYKPGFRLILGRPSFYCDWGFVGSYTYFQAHAHDSINHFAALSSPLIHPAVTPCISELFDSVRGSWKLHYNEWDALMSYDLFSNNPCHLFQPFVGVCGASIRQDLAIDLTQGIHLDTIRWRSKYWGVGLRAGIEYQYLFNRCLRFFTVVHASLLAGEAHSCVDESFCTEIAIKDDTCCLFVPGYHVSVGVIYEGCICRYNYSLRLGYEFVEWRNLPNHRTFSGRQFDFEDGIASPANIRTIGFHGLMAGAGFTF